MAVEELVGVIPRFYSADLGAQQTARHFSNIFTPTTRLPLQPRQGRLRGCIRMIESLRRMSTRLLRVYRLANPRWNYRLVARPACRVLGTMHHSASQAIEFAVDRVE